MRGPVIFHATIPQGRALRAYVGRCYADFAIYNVAHDDEHEGNVFASDFPTRVYVSDYRDLRKLRPTFVLQIDSIERINRVIIQILPGSSSHRWSLSLPLLFTSPLLSPLSSPPSPTFCLFPSSAFTSIPRSFSTYLSSLLYFLFLPSFSVLSPSFSYLSLPSPPPLLSFI